jgi:hypothetical protein
VYSSLALKVINLTDAFNYCRSTGAMKRERRQRVAFALDRAIGDAIGLLVDDKSGFAGMVVNYDSGKLGTYSGALRVGTSGSHVLVEATNATAALPEH